MQKCPNCNNELLAKKDKRPLKVLGKPINLYYRICSTCSWNNKESVKKDLLSGKLKEEDLTKYFTEEDLNQANWFN
jgi:hypothetical protein